MSKPRFRIAPSPTGSLHIGNARTALYNFLASRKLDGDFILRIEDTARDRSKIEYEKTIIDGLHWLGINWDEGPDLGGSYGPYRQSERLQLHKELLQILIGRGCTYHCFCSREELAFERELAQKQGRAPKYSGKCRNLSDAEVSSRLDAGEEATVRFRVESRIVGFDDIVMGKVEEDAGLWGDFVLARSDGTPVYNFAVVVDDHLMDISHVVRGADHISNTFKQIMMYEALDLGLPRFGHMPLTLNAKRQKLSKRDGSVAVEEYRQQGYLPEAVVNFIALLGWNPGDEREMFLMDELIDVFSMDRITKSNAIFDVERLDWFNGVYVRGMPTDQLANRVNDYLVDLGYFSSTSTSSSNDWSNLNGGPVPPHNLPSMKYFIAALELEKERIKKFAELPEIMNFFFVEDINVDTSQLIAKKHSQADTKTALIRVAELVGVQGVDKIDTVEKYMRELADDLGWKAGDLFMPVRIALTGSRATPPLFETMNVLGRQRVLHRLQTAAEQLSF